ncbi:hypothetical protein [Planctomicrobium piriforme]|uniref:Uncharacterized protein n=1 Tax=Planctomicrobium piriforme TaxID=1576369 RepID=A0A1I3HMF8_9PLAN|nr:hypothetical protein [Planctomicrobium piriforme]SFI36904.1 hypothetical protein SAMN05421753_108122 [Planctomicrobium piriforme]
MLKTQFKFVLACGLSTALLSSVGCQGLPRRQQAASGTVVPPLSSSTVGLGQPGGSSAQSVAAVSGVVPPPAPVELPTPISAPVYLPPQSAAHATAAPAPAATTHPVTTASHQSAACVPGDEEWRRTLEQQTAALQERLNTVEQELSETRSAMLQVTDTLATSQARLGQMNQDLVHWQGETRRVEAEMRRQQQADLKSLDELSGVLGSLVEKQRSAQAEPKR